jgi:hypothetical protein
MTQTHDPAIEPLDEVIDHVRGPGGAPLILEYGDYECPYARKAYREIERVETLRPGGVRFAFRHFPLTEIHAHALAASAAAEAAEAAALQHRFWEIHDVLFHGQKALADEDLRAAGRSGSGAERQGGLWRWRMAWLGGMLGRRLGCVLGVIGERGSVMGSSGSWGCGFWRAEDLGSGACWAE